MKAYQDCRMMEFRRDQRARFLEGLKGFHHVKILTFAIIQQLHKKL